MKLTNKIKLLSSLCAASLLAACGDSTTVNTETGSFMKGQASGVIYTTETHTGVTDENGAYQYEPGENISFYIGGTQLGVTVPAGAEVGPMDLVPGVTIPTDAKAVNQFLDDEGYDFGRMAELDAQYELMNILMFLYSADKDKDATNGVTIDPAFHATFANNNYDLKVRSSRFDNIEGIERQFYEAYNAGAVDSARIIRRWKALDDFALIEGLAPQVMVLETYSSDSDGDGMFDYTDDFHFDSRNLFTGVTFEDGSFQIEFNDYGDLLSNTWTDGVDSFTGATTRDIHGNRLVSTEHENGVLQYASTSTYDSYGNRLSQSYDYDADGTPDEITTYSYDSMGNRTSEAYDEDADGTPDEIYIYDYDAMGNLIYESEDYEGDGTPDEIYTYAYDANGNEIEETYDEDGGGMVDEITSSSYDANGNLLTRSYDNDADGTAERTYTYTYDANNNRLSEEYDSNGDGSANRIYTWTYNAMGLITSRVFDYNADGAPDRIYIYEYNAAGQQTLYTQDNNADGTLNFVRVFEYDANGNRTLQTDDTNGDGTINRSYHYEYDADNNQTLYAYDGNADGVYNWSYHREYDAFGNRILESYDNNGDGVFERIDALTYQTVNFLGRYSFVL